MRLTLAFEPHEHKEVDELKIQVSPLRTSLSMCSLFTAYVLHFLWVPGKVCLTKQTMSSSHCFFNVLRGPARFLPPTKLPRCAQYTHLSSGYRAACASISYLSSRSYKRTSVMRFFCFLVISRTSVSLFVRHMRLFHLCLSPPHALVPPLFKSATCARSTFVAEG